MSLVVLRSWSDGPPKVRGIAPSDTDEFVYVPDHRGQFVQQQVGGPKAPTVASSSPPPASSPSTTATTTDKTDSEKTHGQTSQSNGENNRDETPISRMRIGSGGEEIITAEREKTQKSNYQRNSNDEEDNSSITAISDSSCGNSQKHNSRYGSSPNITVLDIHTKSLTNNHYHRWAHPDGRALSLKPRPICDRILLRSSSTSPEQELESPPPASPLSGRYRHLGPELAACIPKRQLKFGTNWLRDDPSNIGIKWSHRRSLSNSTPSLSHSQDFYSSEEEKMSSYSSQSSSKTPSPQPPIPSSSSYLRRHFHFGTIKDENKAQEEITIHRIVETPGLESLSLSSPVAAVDEESETQQYEERIDTESPTSSSSSPFGTFNLKRTTQIEGRYSSSQTNRGHRRPRQRQLLSSPSTPPPPPPEQHDYYRNAHQSIPTSSPIPETALTDEETTINSNPAASYLRALRSANLRSTNLKSSSSSPKLNQNARSSSPKSPNVRASNLKSTNIKSILKSENSFGSDQVSPKVSSLDRRGSSEEDEEGITKSGGKTSKTDVILVHVIRKKLKVKSSGHDPSQQSHSASGSSDSGSDTTEGNPELADLHDNNHSSVGLQQHCRSTKPIKYTTTNSFVKKNNIKNQNYHQLNGQSPINTLSVGSIATPVSSASIAPPTTPSSTAPSTKSSTLTPQSSALISQIQSAAASTPLVSIDAEDSETSFEGVTCETLCTSREFYPEEDSANVSPLLSTLTSSEQIEHKAELTKIQENLTPTTTTTPSFKSNNENDRSISTSQSQEQVRNDDDEGREPLVEDSIPQNFSCSSDRKNKSSVLASILTSTVQVAQVVEKSESQKKRAENREDEEEEGLYSVLLKEGDAEDGKQDQTPAVGIAPGCSAQFTSSTCSSILKSSGVGNNKDTTTNNQHHHQQALVPSDTKSSLSSSCCSDAKGEVPTGAGTLEVANNSVNNNNYHQCCNNAASNICDLCECPDKCSCILIPTKLIGGSGECLTIGSSENPIDASQLIVKDSVFKTTEEIIFAHDIPTTTTATATTTSTGTIAAYVVDQVLTQVEQKIQKTPSDQSGGTSSGAEEEDQVEEDAVEERMERGKNNHQGPSPIASVKIPVQAVNKYVRSDSSDEFETDVNIWRNSAVRESFRGFCQELLESSSNASSQDGLNEGQSSLGSSHEKIIIHVPQSKQQQSVLPCQAINEGVIEFEDDEDVDEDDRCCSTSTGLSLNDRPETPSQRNNSIEYISVQDNVQVNGAVHKSQSDLEYRGVNANEDEDKHQPKPTKWIISLDLGSRSSGFSYWFHGDPNVVHIGSWSGDNCFHKIPSWILTSFDNHTNNKNLSPAEKQPLIVNCASTKVGQEAFDSYMERRGQSSCGTFVSQWREFLQMDSEAARLLTFPYTLDSIDDEMDFVQLVTALVNFFGRAALGQIRSKFFNAFHKDEHLEWLITIPTSWNTHSRQCIREAAYKSGVVKATDGVNLIEDPMAAALFASMCGQYDNFLAVDVGGAFMHYSGFSRNYGKMTQTLEARSLSFPTPESTFETYLTQVVSREFMLYYKAKYRPGWIELMKNFEKAKCKFDGSLTVHSSAFVFLPYSFVHEFHGYTGMQVSECLEEQNTGIRWNDNGALCISEDEMKLILKPTLDCIVHKIESILSKQVFKNIVLTGGFAKCKFLKESITSKFPTTNLIMPKEFPNGVLQGSTLSLMPNIQPKLVIKSPFSIGVGVMTPFDAEVHPAEKKIVKDGKTWCADAWDTLIKYDQEMEINSVINKRSYVGAQPGQSCLVLPLFKSSSSSVPKLVTDKSVVKCCELRFESTKTWQEIDLILSCRASELIVMAVDRDSVVHRVVIDFI